MGLGRGLFWCLWPASLLLKFVTQTSSQINYNTRTPKETWWGLNGVLILPISLAPQSLAFTKYDYSLILFIFLTQPEETDGVWTESSNLANSLILFIIFAQLEKTENGLDLILDLFNIFLLSLHNLLGSEWDLILSDLAPQRLILFIIVAPHSWKRLMGSG